MRLHQALEGCSAFVGVLNLLGKKKSEEFQRTSVDVEWTDMDSSDMSSQRCDPQKSLSMRSVGWKKNYL